METPKKRCGCRKKAENTINTTRSERKEGLRRDPGAAIDAADRQKVSEQLLEERTDILDCNPRNTDM